MKCRNGHTMVPICEYRPDQDGKSYVEFECYRCGDKINMNYQKYNASRQSGQCPHCERKFWGRTILKCGYCGSELPRVLHKSWGAREVANDDIFVPGWKVVAPWDGHVYTPEEWKEISVVLDSQI